jgi:hypothetical protein
VALAGRDHSGLTDNDQPIYDRETSSCSRVHSYVLICPRPRRLLFGLLRTEVDMAARYPGLAIHQVEASVPEQYRQLADGRLDVGIGRAAHAPPEVASRLSATTRSASWSRPATGSPHWTPSRSPSWPKNRCCSPRRSWPRNSTSSPSRCAGRPTSPPPCTRAPWKASTRPGYGTSSDTHAQGCHDGPFGVQMPLPMVSKPWAALRSTLSLR